MDAETRAVIEAAAERTAALTAEKTMQKMLIALGVDATEADDILEMQADFRFVRNLRKSTEAVKQKALRTAVGVLVATFIGVMLLKFGWKPVTP